jgi:hypothetical protein
MYYINGMSTYAQMQYWQTREASMEQYLQTSDALMSAVSSTMTNLYQGEATLTEQQVLSQIQSGSSNASAALLVAQIENANAENGLVSMLSSSSSTTGSSVNLLA